MSLLETSVHVLYTHGLVLWVVCPCPSSGTHRGRLMYQPAKGHTQEQPVLSPHKKQTLPVCILVPSHLQTPVTHSLLSTVPKTGCPNTCTCPGKSPGHLLQPLYTKSVLSSVHIQEWSRCWPISIFLLHLQSQKHHPSSSSHQSSRIYSRSLGIPRSRVLWWTLVRMIPRSSSAGL